MHPPVVTSAAADLVDLPLGLLRAATEVEQAVCGEPGGAACVWVLRQSESEWLARGVDFLLARPLKIAIILVLALVVSHLVQRGVQRFTSKLEASATRALARPQAGGATPFMLSAPLNARSRQRAETLGVVLRSITKAVIGIIAALLVLGEVGLNLGPLIAGAGIVGIALGFGSQTLVRDFLAGIFLLIEDQFGVGDIVDLGDATGTVEAVTLRITRIRDVEGTVWHVPNGEIHRVANFSQEWSRALLDIEVAYDTDLGRAEAVIKRVADEVWRSDRFPGSILEEPEVWGVQTLGADGIVIRLVVKTKPADQWKVLRALRREIKDAFDAEGIEIPFPQRTVWVRGGPAPDDDVAPSEPTLEGSEG
ncbi:MAG TPA: mechanosensitive ion channel family protein [Acidimicrobiales bacterium]|nr:mechanosensitive ion channel family protein [Acidimicrobiales bacterium]